MIRRVLVVALAALVAACAAVASQSPAGLAAPAKGSAKEAGPPRSGPPPYPRPTSSDPEGGDFTMAEATAGLSGSGPLVATISTTYGDLRCTLHEQQAPVTVANFVGLARGVRPFWDPYQGAWVRRPFYDGLVFHRVIPGFMIQGGCPLGQGNGNPGYAFRDETTPALRHDGPGVLSMANAGPGTNGSQFFVTDGPAPHLDTHHTVFGRCAPPSVVARIARVDRDARDRPLETVSIRSVRISRGR